MNLIAKVWKANWLWWRFQLWRRKSLGSCRELCSTRLNARRRVSRANSIACCSSTSSRRSSSPSSRKKRTKRRILSVTGKRPLANTAASINTKRLSKRPGRTTSPTTSTSLPGTPVPNSLKISISTNSRSHKFLYLQLKHVSWLRKSHH